MTDVVLALDAGGTKLLGGLVTRDGGVLHRDEVATPRVAGRCDPGLAALRGLAGRLLGRAEATGHGVLATGLGIAEFVRDGRVTSAEVFDWRVQPRDLLGALAGGAVAVEADVRCAASAEAAARGLTDRGSMLYVSWGTGLSSTLVLDGQCVTGSRGEALALGEWPVDARTAPAWTDSLERFASGLGIAERYTQRTSLAVTGLEVARRAAADDADALDVVKTAADAVARALSSLVQVLDPDLVVLGGGIGAGGGGLPARVRQELPRILTRPGTPDVQPARAGADAGLLGAALSAWEANAVTPR